MQAWAPTDQIILRNYTVQYSIVTRIGDSGARLSGFNFVSTTSGWVILDKSVNHSISQFNLENEYDNNSILAGCWEE